MGIAKDIALITALGGGSGSGQPLATPDWNQNDETAADYIKNRPFYTTDPVETELVNGTFAFVAADGFYTTQDINIELTVGKTYKVILDGVEYETAVKTGHMNDQMAVELFLVQYSAGK